MPRNPITSEDHSSKLRSTGRSLSILGFRQQETPRRITWRTTKKHQGRIAKPEALVGGLVIARFAARLTVHQPIGANADIDHGLAQAAELFTIAIALGLLTLCATILGRAGSSAHSLNLARHRKARHVTLVIGGISGQWLSFRSGSPTFVRSTQPLHSPLTTTH